MRSLFSCLDKYRKDELVKYIASIFLHKDNSGHTLGVSALMSYALISKDGKKHLEAGRYCDAVINWVVICVILTKGLAVKKKVITFGAIFYEIGLWL